MKRRVNAGIVGLGLWVPTEVRTNDAWPASFVEAFHARNEARRTRDFTFIEGTNEARPHDALFVKHASPHDSDPFKGARARRVAPSEQEIVVGDAHAARSALQDAGVDPRDVGVVMSAALVPDRLAPSNGPAIQHLTGCTNAAGIGVEGFCASALVQLELAAALVESGRARFVLCVQSHQISRINDLEGATSPIFGDGASAFVVGEAPPDRGLLEVVRGGDGALAAGVTHVRKGAPAASAVRWHEAGGPFVPGTEDPEAAKHIARNTLHYPIATMAELSRVSGVPLDAVAAFAMIQPLVWYAPAVADGLGVSPDRVPTTYAEYAHLGGAGPIANLLEARNRGLLYDGAHVVLYAHGAGLSRYAALLRWGQALEPSGR